MTTNRNKNNIFLKPIQDKIIPKRKIDLSSDIFEHFCSSKGPHSASSAILQGNTGISRKLERSLGELLQTENVLLFPTGWAVGFGTIVGLVRDADHVVLDQHAHACLMQGARAATRKYTFFRHNDIADCRRKLERIRAKDTTNAILVVSEGIFSMDSDSQPRRAKTPGALS